MQTRLQGRFNGSLLALHTYSRLTGRIIKVPDVRKTGNIFFSLKEHDFLPVGEVFKGYRLLH